MADTDRLEDEMKKKCERQVKNGVEDPVERLRLQCLGRGASGIKGLARYVGLLASSSSPVGSVGSAQLPYLFSSSLVIKDSGGGVN